MSLEELSVGDDGPLYVDRAQGSTGSEAPFHVVYADPDGQRRYGYRCDNCGSVDTAMDTMGRIACGDCPNVRKATEWDAAHE